MSCASPRVIDRALLMRTLSGIEAASLAENTRRAIELLVAYRAGISADAGQCLSCQR